MGANPMPSEGPRHSNLAGYHFKAVVLSNGVFFLFYTLLRVWMAIKLALFDPKFSGTLNVQESGLPPYTLGRVAIPTLLLAGLLGWSWYLCRETLPKIASRFGRDLLQIERESLVKYGLAAAGIFGILTLVPHFTLLLSHLDTQYAFIDIESYTSMIANTYRGDYNPSYEGGVVFGKYYLINMPTLILTFLLGLEHLVAAQNIVITSLVFLSILNIIFTFRNLVFQKGFRLVEEMALLLFALSVAIFILRLTIFRDYFNYDGFLQVYSSGYLGALGSSYMVTCILFVVSYLLRESSPDFERTLLIFLVVSIFMSFSVHDYFHMSLFLLPSVGAVLSLLLSRKVSRGRTVLYGSLLLAFLLMVYGSFLALDIMPRYLMDPTTKLRIIVTVVVALWGVVGVVNRVVNDLVWKVFNRFRSLAVLLAFSFPFFWWLTVAGKSPQAELMGIPLQLSFPHKMGATRFSFLYLLLYALVFSYLATLPIRLLLRNKFFRPLFCVLVSGLLVGSVAVGRSYAKHTSLPFRYPDFYPEERRVLDRTNPYVFDEDGFRVTYNKYLIRVIKYFVRNRIHGMKYWLVSQTTSQGEYEFLLLARTLLTPEHELEGTTEKDVSEFARNVFILEQETRSLEESRFENRYLILDRNFPEEVLAEMDRSPLFDKKYENELYQVYRMEYFK